MKICFVSIFAYPLFNPKCKETFGGSEVQLYQTAYKLSSLKNYFVDFLTGDFGQKKTEKYRKIKVYKTIPIHSSVKFIEYNSSLNCILL